VAHIPVGANTEAPFVRLDRLNATRSGPQILGGVHALRSTGALLQVYGKPSCAR
jgi:hypothetical protein